MEKSIERPAFPPFIRNVGGEPVVELGYTLKYHSSCFILTQKGGNLAHLRNPAVWLASNESSWVTGQGLVVDGGLTAGRRWSQMIERVDQLRDRLRSASGPTMGTP